MSNVFELITFNEAPVSTFNSTTFPLRFTLTITVFDILLEFIYIYEINHCYFHYFFSLEYMV